MKKTLKRVIILPALCLMTMTALAVSGCGHTHTAKEEWTVKKAATCTEKGLEVLECEICGATLDSKELPQKGHNFDTKFTVDQEPTETEVGLKSRHCLNEGCDARTEATEIVTYRIYFSRLNGRPLDTPVGVSFYDANDTLVYQGNSMRHGEVAYVNASVPLGEYKVKLGLPDGFEYEEYYTISTEDGVYPYKTVDEYPTIEITLTTHLSGEGEPTSIKMGDVLPDIRFTTVDNTTITLSEILATKKFIILNYYYNGCSFCRTESTELAKVYEKYKDDMAIICLNTLDEISQIKPGLKSYFEFPDEAYIVSDRDNKYYSITQYNSGTPLSVIIDRGGYVGDIISGAMEASYWEEYIRRNLFEAPSEQESEGASEEVNELSTQPAVLPEKKELFV